MAITAHSVAITLRILWPAAARSAMVVGEVVTISALLDGGVGWSGRVGLSGLGGGHGQSTQPANSNLAPVRVRVLLAPLNFKESNTPSFLHFTPSPSLQQPTTILNFQESIEPSFLHSTPLVPAEALV